MLKSTGGILQGSFPSLSSANEQNIVEIASLNNSLAEETLDLAQNVLPALSLSETSLMLTHESVEKTENLKMGPTSAEKLALQVNFTWLACDYECTAFCSTPLPPYSATPPSSISLHPCDSGHRTKSSKFVNFLKSTDEKGRGNCPMIESILNF